MAAIATVLARMTKKALSRRGLSSHGAACHCGSRPKADNGIVATIVCARALWLAVAKINESAEERDWYSYEVPIAPSHMSWFLGLTAEGEALIDRDCVKFTW